MKEKSPLISVITISYNAEKEIEKTVKSVISQTYSNIEYIIIDGKSTDDTLKLINHYQSHITKLISEKDDGIYFAMNKGITEASGEWIIFMNAGDCFISESILEEIFSSPIDNKIDILFGDVINNYYWGKVKSFGRHFKGKESRLPFCHQSTFVKTSLLKREKFNTTYRSAADHDLMYRLYKQGCIFKHINRFVALYDVYGTSSLSMKSFKEVAEINNLKGGKYLKKYIISFLRHLLLRTLPKKWIGLYQYKKYRKLNLIYSK